MVAEADPTAAVAADSTAAVEVDSTGAEVAFTAAASAAVGAPVSAVAGGRLAAARIAAADSHRAPMAALRIEARWALDRLEVPNRARGSARAWPGVVSAERAAPRELAMPWRTANGIPLEAPAA